MARSFEHSNTRIVEHNARRKHFERTPEEVAVAIAEEAQELVSEIRTSLITGEVFPVVGEIGDLYILLAQLCADLGINPVHAMEMKALRNAKKYDDWMMNAEDTKQEAVLRAKQSWDMMGGDTAFSHLYLNFLAQGDDEEEEA